MAHPRCTNGYNAPSRHRRRKHFAKRQIDDAIGEVYLRLTSNTETGTAFQDLLLRLQHATDLIRPTPELYRWSDACLCVQALENLALHHEVFIRPVQAWRPTHSSRRKTLDSLVHHLLVRYPTPAFMLSAWLRPASALARRQQSWHIRMSRGASIRKLNVPIRMTRRMEGLFLQAPHHFTIEQAMRYAQVIGLGGTKDLARAVIATRMGADLQHDDFWEGVVRFFVQARGMSTELVNPIVDFLYHMRFAKREVTTVEGVRLLDPPQPTYTMKGRSLRSIMRHVEEWHGELAKIKSDVKLSWRRSPVNGLVHLEGCRNREGERVQRIWSITELLSGAELTAEGRAMRHCVGIYGSACSKGRTGIWSLKLEAEQRTKGVLTVEVDLQRQTICQARGKGNRPASQRELEVLGMWADRERLRIGTHL